MELQPIWTSAKIPKFPKLRGKQRFDVVVVGGGITGLTSAYLLKRAGKKVAVLERRRLGGGDTGATTAHLTYVTDERLKPLVSAFGKDNARLAWLGGGAAINTIEQIAKQLNADCEFRRIPGFLHAALDGEKNERKALQQEAELARELGFEAAYTESVPFVDRPGIRFANQALFQPLAYLSALAQAIHGDGSAIFEQTDVTEIEDPPLRISAEGGEIETDYIILATHVPLQGKTGFLSAASFQTKLSSYSTYAVAAKIPSGRVPEASFWDTGDPYYYLRIDRKKKFDVAVFGGEDHKTGQKEDTEACYAALEDKLRELIPEAEFTHRWSGQVVETHDGLPFMGETSPRQFAATGFSGNGMTFGTLAAMTACDTVLGRENPWQKLFAINRKKISGTWDFIKETFDYPYYLVRDTLAPTEGKSAAAVKRGEAKIITTAEGRAACYRDEDGKLSAVSAVCTHLGCVVHWNSGEKTWDCPCHGSRFLPNGEVIAGPAESPLEPISVAAKKPNAETKTPPDPDSTVVKKGPQSTAKRSR